jgi:hypothetical protein
LHRPRFVFARPSHFLVRAGGKLIGPAREIPGMMNPPLEIGRSRSSLFLFHRRGVRRGATGLAPFLPREGIHGPRLAKDGRIEMELFVDKARVTSLARVFASEAERLGAVNC